MRIERWGELRVRITGGTDGQGSGDGLVVVLMHGFGAMGDDLVPLSRALDVGPEVRFVFPEAPHALPPAFGSPGRQWWDIDPARLMAAMSSGVPRDLSEDNPPGIDEAQQQLTAMLAALRGELGVGGERLVLGGFSQGSMLACDVAFRTEEPLGGLVVLSGTLLMKSLWLPAMRARRGFPVFQSHGTADGILSFAGAEALAAGLRDAEIAHEFVTFRGGHEIPPAVLRGLASFLRDRAAT